MRNKNNIPEVRLAGFSGEWEELKVADLSEETIGGGTPRTSIKEYWNGEIPWIQSSDIHEHQVSGVCAKKKITEKGLQNSATKLIPENSIAIVTRVGVGKIALMQFEYATSQDFLSMCHLKVNEWFGVYSIYKQLRKELHNVQGTSIKGITKNELLNKKINIPPNLEEQSKLGNSFKQLDGTIALHQQELTILKQSKQGFLQKMFPKEGESMPEVRFPGFSGEWERRKLGDIAEFNPKSNLPEQFEYVDLESVVGINLISHRTEQKETAPSRAQRLAKQGDVFYQTVRPYQKNNYIFDLPFDNYVFSTGYAQMRPYLDSYFLLSSLQEERFVSNVLDRCTGTSYPAINSNDLAQIEISVPMLKEEQTKIGNFFKQLDETIVLHQRELEALQETKKAFLQKMFV